MAVIQDGRFIVGSSNEVVHQIRNKGYEVQMEQTRIWPGFEISKVSNSLRFTWDPELGGIQGNEAIPNNADSDIVYEFDPAGGTGRVGIRSIETSKWHRTKFRCLVISTNDTVDNDEPPTKITSITNDESGNNIAGSVAKVKTSTYSSLGSFKSSEYGHFADNLSSIYYDNEQIFYEEGSLNGQIKVIEYLITPYRNDDSGLPASNDCIYIHYKVEANNNVSNRGTVVIVDRLYTMFDSNIDLWNIPIPNTSYIRNEVLKVIQFFQKPNILYYTRLSWVSDPKNNFNSSPIISNSNEMNYNDSNKILWLYIELGISPNGGKTIYWNDSHKNSSSSTQALKNLGLSASVPNITSNMLSFEISGVDAKRFVTPSILGTYGSNPSKYVKISYKTYVPNNEANNLNRHQTYYVKKNNLEHEKYGSISTTSMQTINGKNYIASNYNDPNSPSSSFSNVRTKFKISRKTDTDPWYSTLKVILNIDKTNYPQFKREKYHGETA